MVSLLIPYHIASLELRRNCLNVRGVEDRQFSLSFSQVLDLFDAQVRIRQDGFRIASHYTPLHPGVNLTLNESELEDLGR